MRPWWLVRDTSYWREPSTSSIINICWKISLNGTWFNNCWREWNKKLGEQFKKQSVTLYVNTPFSKKIQMRLSVTLDTWTTSFSVNIAHSCVGSSSSSPELSTTTHTVSEGLSSPEFSSTGSPEGKALCLRWWRKSSLLLTGLRIVERTVREWSRGQHPRTLPMTSVSHGPPIYPKETKRNKIKGETIDKIISNQYKQCSKILGIPLDSVSCQFFQQPIFWSLQSTILLSKRPN